MITKANIIDESTFSTFSILDDKYILLKTLGAGATCKVKLAIVKESDNLVAVKIIKACGNWNCQKIPQEFQREIDNLKQVQHENIINLIESSRGVYVHKTGYAQVVDYIVLEYASNGELFDYLFFPGQGLGENISRYIFAQLLDGLEACHKSGIAHRDLKLDNILITSNWTPKIADFGLSIQLDRGPLTSYAGTSYYMAPEIQSRRTYNGVQVDIFSMGVILFTLVTSKLPFERAAVYDNKYRYITQCNYDGFWKSVESLIIPVSDEFKSLVNQLLSFDPSQRPSIEDIRKHSWMNVETASSELIAWEFEKRKEIIIPEKSLQIQEIKEQKKEKNKFLQQGQGGRYRENCEGSDLLLFTSYRECKNYIDIGNPYRINVSGSDTCDILTELSGYFQLRKMKILPNEKYARFTISIDNETNSDIYTEQEGEPELLKIKIDLTKKDDSSYILEFNKINGSKMDFLKLFTEFLHFVDNY